MLTLEKNKIYIELIKNHNSTFICEIQKIFTFCSDFLPKANVVFSNYTGHGIDHSLAVAIICLNLHLIVINLVQWNYLLCSVLHFT